jgi:hypothetical protein
MSEAETIYDAVARLQRTRRMSHALRLLRLIIAKRRCIEVMHGACSLALHKPAPVVACLDGLVDKVLSRARDVFRISRAGQIDAVRVAAQTLGIADDFNFRYHGFCFTGTGFIVGEYLESNPRLLVSDGTTVTLYHPYADDRGVRHIHAVLEHEGTVFITVGDSNKYLDRYRLSSGDLSFERRVMHHLGGFSSACVVLGDCWFGSDFTGRPNYLFHSGTQRKYYFPQPAFLQFSELLIPIDDRFLVCLNMDLTDKRTLSIFDIRTSAFEFCEVRPADSYF